MCVFRGGVGKEQEEDEEKKANKKRQRESTTIKTYKEVSSVAYRRPKTITVPFLAKKEWVHLSWAAMTSSFFRIQVHPVPHLRQRLYKA